ncbi:Protein N-acetyltransferase, RimJ/RimL family [Halogranum gelatinilyticum]|uniref:Protein N-acetyltransferase, RimJ/RimL family n=1 Tax=Halogranum gelatinilyticum TaxID=660521 RepID=A0A1G9PIB1_9EURY|nr:GNAT family protein [Halogranum gelatinilyticum]SDL97937.1 Protein N-acetyltransferase, RimJ/RimL family [Halogranum gelatinilyticum]
MPGPVFLTGDDVTLRTVERDDLDFLQRNRNHPAVRRWMPRVQPENREQLEADFEGYMSDTGGVNLLACVDGDAVGFCSLFDVNHDSGRAELAAWVTPDAQGAGYGTEAAELLVEYAFAERRLHRLVAGALATNEPSRAGLETLGFVEEGRQRDQYFVDGEYVDRVLYGLLESEWRNGAS